MQYVKIPSGSMITHVKPSKINMVALSAPTKPNIKSFRTGCCEGAADGENETLRALVPMRAYLITFRLASHESLPVTRDCGSPSATLLLFSVLFQAFFPQTGHGESEQTGGKLPSRFLRRGSGYQMSCHEL